MKKYKVGKDSNNKQKTRKNTEGNFLFMLLFFYDSFLDLN